jgi:hypothetical protein
MENAITYLIAHPLLFVIAIILAVIVVFSSLKKMVRMLLIAASLLVLYGAYVYVTGGDVHEAFSRIEQSFAGVLRYLWGVLASFTDQFNPSKKQ